MGFVPVAPQAVHMVVPMRFTAFNPSFLRVLDATDDVGDLVERGFVLAHEALGLVHGMNNGGVVTAAKETSNGWIAELGHVSEDIHGDLAC